MKAPLLKLSIVLILATSINSQGQDLNNTQTILTSNSGTILTFDIGDKTIQGSPYINKAYSPARVTADSQQTYNARYNAVSDEIEVETDKSTIQVINKLIPGITVTFLSINKIYKGMTYFNKEGNTVNGYLIELSRNDQKVKLFLKEKIVFIDRKPASTGYDQAKPAIFKRVDDSFYITINNEIPKPLSTNKKEIASLFPSQEKEILNYISTEKVNTKKQEDLVKLVSYINQISK